MSADNAHRSDAEFTPAPSRDLKLDPRADASSYSRQQPEGEGTMGAYSLGQATMASFEPTPVLDVAVPAGPIDVAGVEGVEVKLPDGSWQPAEDVGVEAFSFAAPIAAAGYPIAFDAAPAEPQKETKEQGALATLAEYLPAEGIAAYTALYAIVISVRDHLTDDGFRLLAFATVLAGVLISAAFVIAPHIKRLRALEKPQRRLARSRLLLQAIALGALLIVYIAASPANPYVELYGLPLPVGLGIAGVVALAIGVGRKLYLAAMS